MKARLIGGAAAALLALGVGGYFVAQHEADRQLAVAIANMQAAFGPGTTIDYRAARTDALRRSAVIDGLAIHSPDLLITVANLSIGGASQQVLRRVEAQGVDLKGPGGTAIVDRLQITDLTLPDAKPDQPFDPLATTFDHAAFRGLRYGTTGPKAASIQIEAGAIDGYNHGRDGHLEGNYLSLLMPGGQQYDSTTIVHASLDMPDLAGMMARARGGVSPNLHGTHSLVIEGFAIRKAGDTLAKLDSARSRSTESADGVRFSLDCTGVEILQIAMLSALSDLGYNQARGDLHLVGSYDRTAQTLDVSSYHLSVQDMGSIAAKLRLTEVPPLQAGTPQAYAAIRIAAFDLTYVDQSLFDHMVKVIAARRSDTADEVKADWVQMLDRLAQGGGPDIDAIHRALVSFVRKPGTLEIGAHPAQPVPVVQAIGLARLNPATVSLLGLQVSAR